MKNSTRFVVVFLLFVMVFSGCIALELNLPASPPSQSNITVPTPASKNITPPAQNIPPGQNAAYPSAAGSQLFGSMLAYNINDGMMGIPGLIDTLNNGWSEFRNDNSNLQKLKSNLGKIFQERAKTITQSGMSVDREIAGYFTWNVIEPEKGQFNWELTDLMMKHAGESGVQIVAVIQPFAAWDQQNTQNPSCKALDFAYYDFKARPPTDMEEYKVFLTKLVERYDGDGKDDMPSLKTKVAYWEIGNEVDGACGGFENNAEGYVKLLTSSFETIKKADPQAKVLNAGALDVTGIMEAESVKSFWKKFFELGGWQYLDYFNFHYNAERSAGNSATPDSSSFLENLNFFNGLMEKNNGRKPIWITEFGTYSGTPKTMGLPPNNGAPPSQTGFEPTPQKQTAFPTQSQEFQAAWYFKNSIIGFANGADRIFIDLIGRDNDIIGGSAAFNLEGEPRLFVVTLKTISAKISGFSKAEKIDEGQYKFTVNGKAVYALWSGTLPNEISGKVRVTDMTGVESIEDVSEIELQSDQPVFVEPAS